MTVLSAVLHSFHQLTVLHLSLCPPQGKEFETRLKEKKPGDLSDELRIALGMPVGPVGSPTAVWYLMSITQCLHFQTDL